MGFWWGPSATEIREFLATQEPIVLMGRGHSGTRVLAYAVQALGVNLGFTNRMASGDPEDKRFRRGLAKLARRWDVGDVPPERELRPFCKLVYQWHRRLAPTGAWGWKYPETYLMAPHVHAVFPRARYLHIVRDGRDLAFKRHRTHDPDTVLGRRVLAKIGAIDEPGYLCAAISWAYQVELFTDFAHRHLSRDRVFDCTFEELCADPVGVTRQVATFLSRPMPDAAVQFLRDFTNPDKIADHRSRKPERIRAVEERIGPALRRFGYLPSADTTAAAHHLPS
jgi:hypothetical protein